VVLPVQHTGPPLYPKKRSQEMSLNPITALSEQLQKLINEHGSAAILRDHLALFKDQVLLLEKENTRLITENVDLLRRR
jgi:protein-arginine kinase activator protein McsA